MSAEWTPYMFELAERITQSLEAIAEASRVSTEVVQLREENEGLRKPASHSPNADEQVVDGFGEEPFEEPFGMNNPMTDERLREVMRSILEDDDPTFDCDPSWNEVAEIIRRLKTRVKQLEIGHDEWRTNARRAETKNISLREENERHYKNNKELARIAARTQAENEQVKEWVNDLHSGMYVNCVYCGHRYGPNDEVPVAMANVLKEHIEVCPKHPMSLLKTKNAKLREENDRLKSKMEDIQEHEAGLVRELGQLARDRDTWRQKAFDGIVQAEFDELADDNDKLRKMVEACAEFLEMEIDQSGAVSSDLAEKCRKALREPDGGQTAKTFPDGGPK